MDSISSVKYYRDDAALTILGNLTEQNSENTQTLADVSVRLSTLEDSSTISVMGSGNSYAAGLVLAGNSTHGNEFLRKDGTWVATSVSGLAPLASPAFTGTPSLPTGTTAITQATNDASTKLATTQYVTLAVAGLVDSAPDALNTLNELAEVLGSSTSVHGAVINSLSKKPTLATGQPNTTIATNGDAGSLTSEFLNKNGTWATPPDTIYTLPATVSTNAKVWFRAKLKQANAQATPPVSAPTYPAGVFGYGHHQLQWVIELDSKSTPQVLGPSGTDSFTDKGWTAPRDGYYSCTFGVTIESLDNDSWYSGFFLARDGGNVAMSSRPASGGGFTGANGTNTDHVTLDRAHQAEISPGSMIYEVGDHHANGYPNHVYHSWKPKRHVSATWIGALKQGEHFFVSSLYSEGGFEVTQSRGFSNFTVHNID